MIFVGLLTFDTYNSSIFKIHNSKLTIHNSPITTYPVMEAFYTLQGEGFHQGKAAYFIRLAGCDVGCVWCDVKESWDEEKYPLQTY